MRISAMHWLQVEEYLKRRPRVVPLGSTEQHAYLSLSDRRHPGRAGGHRGGRAAGRAGVPGAGLRHHAVLPGLPRHRHRCASSTYVRMVRDLLDGLTASGFRRILIVNGHGGNSPAQALVDEWLASSPGVRVRWHNWWNAPRPGPRCRRSTRWPRTPRGWRTSPGRGWPAWRMPDGAEADRRTWRGCTWAGRRARAAWATATSAGATSAPTTRCWRSGRWRWPRRAR